MTPFTRRQFLATSSFAPAATLLRLQDPRSLYAQITPATRELVLQARAAAASARMAIQKLRGNVATLKKQGKPLQETIAAKPTAAFDDPWGKGFVNPATFTTLVYQGV